MYLRFPALMCALGVALASLPASSALAGGYHVDGQSGKLMGQAYAGKAAQAEDASTVYFNPAGLTRLRRTQVSANLTVLPLDATIHNRGSTTVLGQPMNGEQAKDGVATEFVPSFFASHPLSRRVVIGLGLTVPYGLGSDYDNTWFGRYFATRTRLEIFNLNPAVGVQVSRQWSLGVGVSAQYIDGTLGNMIDYGSIGAQNGLVPQGSDGEFRVRADDWGFGYNVGVMFEPRCGTRLGVSYRSHISHTLNGNASFDVPPEAQPITGGGVLFQNTSASVPVETPDSLMASFYHQVSPRWSIVGDLTWTNWSRVQSLRVDFGNPLQPPVSIPARWTDTVRPSLGAIYQASPRWKLRAGVAYDPSPVPASTRSPLLPETDRFWFAVGASYDIGRNVTLDLSYAYLYSDDAAISLPGTQAGSLAGNTVWSSMGIAVGLTWKL